MQRVPTMLLLERVHALASHASPRPSSCARCMLHPRTHTCIMAQRRGFLVFRPFLIGNLLTCATVTRISLPVCAPLPAGCQRGTVLRFEKTGPRVTSDMTRQ